MTYEQALAGLNAAQKKAVTTTEGPVLVIAGPGTGKTQLLTTRIAHILATTDTLPQNILCLTFTDSAAQTMRDRLSGMVGSAAYDVTISTYHAFGSDLIRRFPDYFGDSAALQPIDDLGSDHIFREIIGALPFNSPLKYADNYVRDVKSLISDAKRALLSPGQLRGVAKQNLKYIATASPTVAETLGDMPRITKKDMPHFAELAQKLATLPQATPADNTVAPLGEPLLKELTKAVADAEAVEKATPLTKWKNAWLARDNAGRFVVDGQKANEKLLAIADVYEQYLAALKAQNLFDYDDMILRAVHALETNDDLRFTLQEQYLYILLDEFQDTNGAQLKLVELLTNNPASEGRPNVLAVGDDDQAIYAFQGADYSHMLQFTDMYRDVLPVPLTQNYRSHADILHTARGIAEQIEERLHHHFPQIEKTLTAENKELPKKATIERREAASDVMQFAWVTKRIKQLLADGVPPSEIAVLAPQHRYLEPLVPFLQQADIPVRYDKRENVLDNSEINQLLRMSELCQALAAGQRAQADALWAEVLSFPFWRLSTSRIWQLSWQSRDDDQPWTDALLADGKLRPIALFFIRLSQLTASETLEAMLDYLIGSSELDLQEPGEKPYTSPFYGHYFGDLLQHATFWDLLSNLTVLRARLRDYKRNEDGPLLLADLLEFVTAHRAAEIQILDTSPYTSGSDAVQLMTAFKSKGMEFSAVFVLAVSDEAWGTKARGGGSRIGLPANLQFIRYAGATNDERLRLFYVAITRAKTQLYLLNYTATYAGKSMTRLKYLSEASDSGVAYSTLLPERDQLVLPAEDDTPAPTTELAAYWQRRHEQALGVKDMRALLESRLATFQLSPTHVNDFTDVMYCGPEAFFLRTILRFPQAPGPQVQFGNAMHETLEWIHTILKRTGDVPHRDQVLATFAQRLAHKRLGTHDTAQFLERGQAALTVYLRQRAATLSADNVAEYNFRNEGVLLGDAHLAGKIDKLVIDRKQKTLAIVDYKTGKSYSKWAHDAKLHKYRQQLYLYRALVEGSHTFAGYRVTDAYLEFVEPDENGDIQELHVSFDEQEYQRVKQLAQVVWKHIKAISLPDTAGYSADIAGIQQFEQDLLK